MKPLPHEMNVRRLRSENNLYTEALCSYHVAGKMKASCFPQPYALEPMYGSPMSAVRSFWQKVSDASTPHMLSIMMNLHFYDARVNFLRPLAVGTKCLLSRGSL